MSAAGFVAVDGLRVHVRVGGAGEPVLLLHGFTGSSESMADLAERLGRFRTVRPDLVGHGRTDAPRDLSRYTMRRCGEDLASLLDALGIERAHVLGYSMGGRLALWLCAAHPGRVRSAVLVGASAGLAEARERERRRLCDEALADEIERDGVAAFVERWRAQPLFASQSRRLAPEQQRAIREQRLRSRPVGLANSLRGMGTGVQPALHARLAEIATPVLFLAGAEDAKFRAIARDLAARMPRATAELVPEAGHAAHLENPDHVALLAARHFAAVDPCERPGATPRRASPTREVSA